MRFMTLRSLLPIAASAALLSAPLLALAEEISAAEEQRLEALARENAEVYRPRSNVTVGFRMLSSGANVQFGHLGSVPREAIPVASAGAVNRLYDNGYVRADAVRPAESATTTTTLPGGRYQTTRVDNVTDASGTVTGTTTVVTGNFLSYLAGLSRDWSYSYANQITGTGQIAMRSYSAESDGAKASNKQGPSGGLELQFSRVLSRASKRAEWGFTTGVSLNDINSKANGSILATLRTNTDLYSLNGLPVPNSATTSTYVAPSFADLTDGTGALIAANGLETTTPINQTPASSSTSAVVGGTTVNGNWKLRGSYFMVKVGPSLRGQITERLGFNASLGVAGAYAGTRYSVVETFIVPDVGRTATTPETEFSDATKFLSGFYADLNLEWAANEVTGLFAGLTAQKFGDYNQSVGGRTAHIDLGSTVGLRGGVSIRF